MLMAIWAFKIELNAGERSKQKKYCDGQYIMLKSVLRLEKMLLITNKNTESRGRYKMRVVFWQNDLVYEKNHAWRHKMQPGLVWHDPICSTNKLEIRWCIIITIQDCNAYFLSKNDHDKLIWDAWSICRLLLRLNVTQATSCDTKGSSQLRFVYSAFSVTGTRVIPIQSQENAKFFSAKLVFRW